MIHPLFMGVCDAILGPSCACYQLNLAHLIARGPGAEHQFLHRDELVWNLVPRPHPELQLASIVALVDFDAANGATRVVPGSHRWGYERQETEDEVATASMAAGSAVVYLGSTIHGGGANTTASTWRRGVHISYTLGWLRTEENNYLAVPPAVARTLPRRCQEVLGYAVHDALPRTGGYLGMVSLRDPVGAPGRGRARRVIARRPDDQPCRRRRPKARPPRPMRLATVIASPAVDSNGAGAGATPQMPFTHDNPGAQASGCARHAPPSGISGTH
jgi:hypothetical protein